MKFWKNSPNGAQNNGQFDNLTSYDMLEKRFHEQQWDQQREVDIILFLIQVTFAQLKARLLIMISKIASLSAFKYNSLIPLVRWGFSKQKEVRKVVQSVQTVGFKSKNIQNIRSLSYKPKHPIQYINGRCLIYQSQRSIFRTLKDYFWYLLGIACLCFMLYHRFHFDSNPIIKHLYIGAIFLMLVGIARKFLRNHNVVKQMYLLQGGKATQVIFQNQLKRKIFGQITQNTYYNSLFFTPTQQQGETIWKPLNMFPQTIESIEQEATTGDYWKKLYMNHENFLLIPKSTQFINTQVLVEVMNGKVILN